MFRTWMPLEAKSSWYFTICFCRRIFYFAVSLALVLEALDLLQTCVLCFVDVGTSASLTVVVYWSNFVWNQRWVVIASNLDCFLVCFLNHTKIADSGSETDKQTVMLKIVFPFLSETLCRWPWIQPTMWFLVLTPVDCVQGQMVVRDSLQSTISCAITRVAELSPGRTNSVSMRISAAWKTVWNVLKEAIFTASVRDLTIDCIALATKIEWLTMI